MLQLPSPIMNVHKILYKYVKNNRTPPPPEKDWSFNWLKIYHCSKSSTVKTVLLGQKMWKNRGVEWTNVSQFGVWVEYWYVVFLEKNGVSMKTRQLKCPMGQVLLCRCNRTVLTVNHKNLITCLLRIRNFLSCFIPRAKKIYRDSK